MQPITTKPMISIDQQIITSLRTVLGEGTHVLHEPRFQVNEQRYVQECIASTFVSSIGQYVDRFGREIAAFTGARRAVALVNGKAALQVDLKLAGVEAGDEVLLPVAESLARRIINIPSSAGLA
jgi:perosamine synthetase